MEDRAAPGVPRPRTRGARRRPATPLGSSTLSQRDATLFPSLTRPVTAHSGAGKAPVQGRELLVQPDDDRERLQGRLLASGLKRSVVQVQLFPGVKDHRASSRARHVAEDNQAESGHSRNRPLAAAVRPPNALVPTRPMSVSSQRQKIHSARATRDNAVQKVEREPLSARDKYYVDQRATTAPRRRLKPQHIDMNQPAAWEEPAVENPTVNLEREWKANDLPASPRRELLARHSDVRTLTEKLVEDLSRPTGAAGSNMPSGTVPRDSFFYLRRVDSNPYNMEVTTHSRINPNNYYTVSRLGITHFSPDGVDFQPLDKFERENYIYSLLVKLPFFKKYRIWKKFTIWKKTLNTRKRLDAYSSLNNNLFILLPHLHDALFQLRRSCLDFQQAKLFDFEHPEGSAEADIAANDATNTGQQQKTYTLSDFAIRLKAQKMRVERLVDRFISDAEMTAKKACENFLFSFLQTTGFNENKAVGDNANGRRRSSLGTPHRKGSCVSYIEDSKAGEQKGMTYTERATMRTQCRKLTKFLRVVEFLVSDALLRMAISSAVSLKEELATFINDPDGEDFSSDNCENGAGSGKSQTAADLLQQPFLPLFRVEVVLDNSTAPNNDSTSGRPQPLRTGMSPGVATTSFRPSRNTNLASADTHETESPMGYLEFVPNAETLRLQLETLVFNGLMAVTNRDRLIRNSMFKAYVEASLDEGVQGEDVDNDSSEITSEGMDLDILIMEDTTFVETLQSLNAIVLDGYECAEENCGELSMYLARYQDNERFCKEVVDSSRFLHTDAVDFRGYLDKYMQEAQDVGAVADFAPCGLLLLDRVRLNAILKPAPRKCVDALHRLIPVIFRQLNDTLASELTIMNDRISMTPTTVDDFSASLDYLRELQSGQAEIEERYSSIRSLYHVIEEYRVKFTDIDQMNAFMLTQKKTQLKASMDLFENTCVEYTVKFGIELEARLPNLASKLASVSNALSDSVLFDLNSDINDTIAYLICVEGDVSQLETAVKQHFAHEKTLGLPLSTAFDELEDLQTDLSLKIEMWKAVRDWKSFKSEWEGKKFPDEVDLPSIVEVVERFHNQITKWEEKLPVGMGGLCAYLKADVEEYRTTMPILTDLQCPSFEERHFSQLGELLGFGIRHLGLHRTVANTSSIITLGELVLMHLSPYAAQINRIATEATQERLLKDTLTKIIVLWERQEFEVKSHKDSKDYCILVSLENVYTLLEECLIGMTAVLSSKFISPIKDTAVMWQKRLLLFQETLDAWIECQRKWMHLETIFAAPDIQKQLPDEAATFLAVNQFWKDLMRRTRDQRNCLKVSGAILIGVSSTAKSLKEGVGVGGSGVGQALLDSLTKHNSSLERIEKSLEDYLETKRRSFPRFYFISNDELLEVLAHAKEPQVVQRHLPKCFDALAKLVINNDGSHGAATTTTVTPQDIAAIVSPEGERIAFGRPIKARGNVEDWLNAVLSNMKLTLHRHVKNCLADFQHSSREMWLFRHPAQAVAVVSYIVWAKECEFCFKSSSQDPTRELSLWHQTICTQLSNLTRLIRTSLTSVQRRVVVSLVTTDVHFRDVVESLVLKRVTDSTDFLWEQQLRYQWYSEHDECEIHQANCRIKYGYEYMGACSRLVITPLTDRCWMTITGALELRYGAAPSGPAGTGKTETSKDLAKALGILCIVINCSSQMSYKMMGSILNGVVQAGTWVCLDEFNRIDIEVLSVVGQQMAVLRNARLMNSSEVLLDDRCVPLRDHHVIITMNPGYAGRTELPDNLKVSFRPVAMMVPDYALIAEIVLFAEGFQMAKPLSRKVTKLYKLCSEQLSQQGHYDFGMRAVRSVLTMAGSLKRSTVATGTSPPNGITSDTISATTFDESVVLIKAMVGANAPKLTDEDAELFHGIVKDLFPEIISTIGVAESQALLQGLESSSPTTSADWLTSLDEEIDTQLRRNQLQSPRQWKKKLLQLFATLEVRVGVVQIGSSGSGKTTATNVLKAAVTTLRDRAAHPDTRFQRVVSFTLNPKAISMIELYGFFHPVTREWTDGLASKLLRTCIMEKNEEMLLRQNSNQGLNDPNLPFYWITFDGPIDAQWIESMNTVLDDNMTLCLANGERIKLLPRIQLIFEVADTAAASPATISRLGVVYYHPSYLGWQPFVETWVYTLVAPEPTAPAVGLLINEPRAPKPLSSKMRNRILKYFDVFVKPGLAFVRATKSSTTCTRVPISTCDLAFVGAICHIFEALLKHRAPPELFAAGRGISLSSEVGMQSVEEDRKRCLDLMFIFSFTWAIGGNLNLDPLKSEFQEFLHALIVSHEEIFCDDILAVNGKIPTQAGLTEATGDIQDFFIDFQYLSLSPWMNSFVEQAQQLQQSSRISSGHFLVPTLDVLKYRYLVELLSVDARLPVLLTGATGAGKSAIVNHILDVHARIAADIDPSDADVDSPLSVIAHGKVLPLVLNLSAQTTSASVQLTMESKFAKKRRTLLGAPVNKQLVVVFVDDINMPNAEQNGAQPVVELLRQYMEFKGFYDRDKFFWKDVQDAVLIAAGGLPGGGRQVLCPRFVRHFSAVFCLPSCDEFAMKAIFNAILASTVAGRGSAFTKTVKDTIFQTADATCELFQTVVTGLLPTPAKCHYTFNLRDLVKLMEGVVCGIRSSLNANKTGNPINALTTTAVVNLWAHESIRVFRDRLTDKPDRMWFSEQLVSVANKAFGLCSMLESMLAIEGTEETSREQPTDGNVSSPKQEQGTLLFSPRRVGGGSDSTPTTIRYDQVSDLSRYEAFLNSQIMEYNSGSRTRSSYRPPLELVLFEDAIVHTAAIARILMQPRGHVLLLGMGGCGKRSLARLAAYTMGYRCFEIELKKDYGLTDFRDDLKAMMKLCVLGKSSDGSRNHPDPSGVPAVFLLNDSQLSSDAFLEDINTILNGGDIPKLFAPDELEIILNSVRTLLERLCCDSKAGLDENETKPTSAVEDFTRKDCEDYFHSMVQNSFHFIICMNPLGNSFRARVRQFPALINCTTIDYFDEWPKAALEYVAQFYLTQNDPLSHSTSGNRRMSTPDLTDSPAIRSAVTTLCVEAHQSVSNLLPSFHSESRRQVFITSQHYLDLIALFRRIYRETRMQWETKLHRLKTGVVKLEETNSLVSTLQDELVALQPVLSSKTKEAEELLKQVAVDQAEAEKVAQRVRSDEAQVKQQQQQVAACQADAQRDLDQALPALNAAVVALDSLDKKDITEVKGFVKPPQAVQFVMEAICIMLGEKADWDTSKRILSRSTFMTELKEYDKDAIPAAILKRIHKYIEHPDFAVEEVKKVSRAAMSLCMWVHAVATYARVYREVAPKRLKLAEMNAVLADANAKLEAKQHELSKVMLKVQNLKDKCDTTLAEKQRLIEESGLTQRRLKNAEKLTVGLDDERVRWKSSINVLKQEGNTILGDSFVAAACMTYLGPFNGLFRDKILCHWAGLTGAAIGVSVPFTLANAYGDAQELREWQLLGLPSDNFSADNAIYVLKGKQRWALMIDPQQQATQWIKSLEALYHLEIVKSGDNSLMQVVERCLGAGRPLLIEDVDEALNPSLDPVLAVKAYQYMPGNKLSARKVQVKLEDRLVETDADRFRLYLTTKLSNPHFVPDIFIRVNVINFTVTSDGLEEQLLSNVVKRERMEIEERKHTLLVSIARDQKQLHDIEIKILNLLSDAKGNILDDIALIQALKTSKQTSNVVAERLADSEATKEEVLEIRNQYHAVAVRGALLFFIVTDLVTIDPMYQYSLEYFTRLFNISLDEAPTKQNLARLETLNYSATLAVYRNICRGLFQVHRRLFAFIICLQIMVKAGELSQSDIRLLDQSTVKIDLSSFGRADSKVSNTADEFETLEKTNGVPITRKYNSTRELKHGRVETTLLSLTQSAPIFSKVLESYYRDNEFWNNWLARQNPFITRLPGDLDGLLPRFLRLVLVRWLREDAFVVAVRCFIEQTLGAEFLGAESSEVVMSEVYSSVDKTTPGLFILSPGADPISALETYARENGVGEDRYHALSLGQGQGPIAEAKLAECKTEGHWLVLQNVHLAKSWLPTLQSLLGDLKQGADVHKDFRLFLASFPVAYFPISILQNSVKVMTEPPKGVKANLQHSVLLLKNIDISSMRNDESNIRMKLRLAFGLCFFHAVARERAKFGTLGWNLKYDFSDADFVSVVTLQRRLIDTAASHDLGKAATNEDAAGFNIKIVPWGALLFLAGEIYYGGRVTDEYDRRCLMAVLRRFCSESSLATKTRPPRCESTKRRLTNTLETSKTSSLLGNNLLFSQDEAFCVPEFHSLDDILRFVDNLPDDIDNPQLFGMHPNAQISYERQQSQHFLQLAMQLQPPPAKGNSNGVKAAETPASADSNNLKSPSDNGEADRDVVSLSEDIQAKLPSPKALEDVESTLLENRRDSFSIVLQQEIAACHNLVRHVDESLKDLQNAIRGITVMSVTMEKTLGSLALHEIPADWVVVDTHSTRTGQSLSEWVSELLFRCGFLHRWALNGRAPCNAFPLSIFAYPQGLFTAILQRHAREHAIPIHFLDLQFRVLDNGEFDTITVKEEARQKQLGSGDVEEEIEDLDESVYLTGLVLEGARWDSEAKCLSASLSGVMEQTMPAIQVIPFHDLTLETAGIAPAKPVVSRKSTRRLKEETEGQRRKKTLNAGAVGQIWTEGQQTEATATHSIYSCPVYRTAMRKGTLSTTGTSTNLVLAMGLPCDRELDYFVLNGTALVCSSTKD